MSQDATFGQATHTLTVIDQQKPSIADLKVLHDGYLADLLRAIKLGKVPARPDFQKFLGLVPELNIWRTLILGQHKSHGAYRKALESARFRIGDYAGQILNKISITKTEVDLVVLSVADLGFKTVTRRDAIYARALELGLQLCPAEVGPALRLAYPEQPSGEWRIIAMEPLTGADGDLRVFGVARDGGDRWLNSDYGPDGTWNPGDRWVFRLPRK